MKSYLADFGCFNELYFDRGGYVRVQMRFLEFILVWN
jgi:hypothetical protein